MTERLKEELQRLGDRAPELRVPDDTWSRGRRARHRDHLLTGLLVASIVVLAGSLIRLTPAERLATDVLAPRPDAVGVGLPERLYDVPYQLTTSKPGVGGEVSWDPDVAQTDLAIGPAVLAFTVGAPEQLPVVVDADGDYHLVALPGFSDAGLINAGTGNQAAMALAPDGTRLAYAWWDPEAPLDRPMPAGIRVVDLRTGTVRTLTLEGGDGVDVDRVAWSPDGRWLAWSGGITRSWTPLSRMGSKLVAGRVEVSSLRNETIPGAGQEWGVSVDDDGVVTLWSGLSLRTWDGTRMHRFPVPEPRGVSDLPTASGSRGGEVALSPVAPSDGAIRVYSGRSEELTYLGGIGPADDADSISPVGWLGTSRLLILERPAGSEEEGRLSLSAPIDGPAGGADQIERVDVGSVDSGVGSLTVASDLIDPDAPTVDYAEPPWERSTNDSVLLGLGLALVAALGLAVVVRRRRLP